MPEERRLARRDHLVRELRASVARRENWRTVGPASVLAGALLAVGIGVLAPSVGSAALAIVGAGDNGRDTAATTRLVDRTVRCSTTPDVVGRSVLVSANPAGATTGIPATVGVSSGRGEPEDTFLVGVEARGTSGRPTGGVSINRRRCALTKERIPLSRKSLPGPPTLFATGVECATPRYVLVRVRAALLHPASWTTTAAYKMVRADVRTASVAIQTYRPRRVLAFAAIEGTESRIWSSGRCD